MAREITKEVTIYESDHLPSGIVPRWSLRKASLSFEIFGVVHPAHGYKNPLV